jgi:hypothetical protein
MSGAILIQGMRRSGTTILYDALLEDPGLHCFYEPLREDTETPGGGSGARESDPFAETRELRREFRDADYPDLDLNDFNIGGPKNPEQEIGPGLPAHAEGFLRTLLERDERVMIKETRFYDKLGALSELAPPESVLVHVVRDPRSVAVSMMMGRDRKRADSYSDPDAFFGETERRKLWSSRRLSQELLKGPEYREIGKLANFERILLVWKHTFESTWRRGRVLFPGRYVLLRNEELRADTAGAIGRVYEAAGLPTPLRVTEWARDKVRPPEQVYAGDDPRWARAFAKLGMRDALVDAGYGELAEREAEPPRGGPGLLGRMLGR